MVARPKNKIKKNFVIRDTSANVYKTLSPQGAHLWMTMRRLADAKTGALCLPSGHWITGARISREARMHDNTRQVYMRELYTLGLAHGEPYCETKLIADRLTGHVRERSVRAGFHYSVSESPRPDWVSSKPQSRKPHKQRVSSKPQKATTSSKTQSFKDGRIVPASTVSNPPDGRPDVHPGVGSGSDVDASIPRETDLLNKAPAEMATATALLPEWMPLPEWGKYVKLRARIKPLNEDSFEIAVHTLAELRNSGNDIAAILKRCVLNGWTDLRPLERVGNQNQSENERLGLSRYPGAHPTTADRNARMIKNQEVLGAESLDGSLGLPPGTFQALKLKLLSRGTTFADDPEVLGLVGAIVKQMASNTRSRLGLVEPR